jgi:hypothetical protein
MSNQNPPVEPATPEESYDFLLSNDDIKPSGMTELDIYKATIGRRYIETGAARCLNPDCGSADIPAGEYNADGDWVAFKITCNDCGTEWEDVYLIKCVTNIVLPDEQGGG